MKLKQDDILVFAGDSITDQGRVPAGEGSSHTSNWGHGYVNLVGGYLSAEYPDLRIRVINQGINGNQSGDLLARWDQDILSKNPTWVVILIGINDVWRKFDSPYLYETHVTPEEYKENLVAMVEKTLPFTKNIVFMTPYMIETNPADAMLHEMQLFGGICKAVAAQYGLPCLDLQAGFDRLLACTHPMHYGWDRIHPTIAGHTMIANTLLRYLDAMK